MDWDHAIERNREQLTRIVAALFAMVGLDEGGSVSRLSIPIYRAVLRILYPAEAAVRRLIAVAARGLRVKLPPARPMPATLRSFQRKGLARMSFPLCDPRSSCAPQPRHSGLRTHPRIHAFANGQLVTILGRSPFDPTPQPDGMADAVRLCHRLSAVKSALENLPREARRLARWQARVAAKPAVKFRKALRPGPPPAVDYMPQHEVNHALKECHWLAWEAAWRDTS